MAFDFDPERYWAANPVHIPPPPHEATFLYLMRCDRFTKVGIASDVDSRRETLQRSNPLPVKVATKFGFPQKRYALCAERLIHGTLVAHRVHAEWFDVEYAQVHDLAKRVAAATRTLAERHAAAVSAHYEAVRERYDTDPAYRAEVDARLGQLENNWRSMEHDIPCPA